MAAATLPAEDSRAVTWMLVFVAAALTETRLGATSMLAYPTDRMRTAVAGVYTPVHCCCTHGDTASTACAADEEVSTHCCTAEQGSAQFTQAAGAYVVVEPTWQWRTDHTSAPHWKLRLVVTAAPASALTMLPATDASLHRALPEAALVVDDTETELTLYAYMEGLISPLIAVDQAEHPPYAWKGEALATSSS